MSDRAASVAVVTVVSGRHDHLRVQRQHLARCAPAPCVHVVVAIDDPAVADVLDAIDSIDTHLVLLATHPAGLPVAAARNAGAAAALARGASTLVFLDVDCIPDESLLGTYETWVRARPDAVVSGAVTYLPATSEPEWPATALRAARAPHAARPDPAPGKSVELTPELFWSLSFAMSARLWRRLEPFYEGYVGYGGEDTDFAVTAADAGTELLMVGGADAFHQHHAVSRPPVEHLRDIARNAGVYRRRHAVVPMRGWLDDFAAMGLLTEVDPPRLTDAVRVATVPARHEYLDATLPPTVRRVDVERVTGWEPDPLLTPTGLAQYADGVDVVHLHFGYEHLRLPQLRDWVSDLRRRDIPLVVTVHDLRNPHSDRREPHDEHLRVLLDEAAAVLTLTAGAADECLARFGRRPQVVPHPTLLESDAPARSDDGAREILLPLRALRTNVVDPLDVVVVAARAAASTDGGLRVLVDPDATRYAELAGLRELPGHGTSLLTTETGRLPHDELCSLVASAWACLLPYRFGTHSGWLELARDLGTHVIAPDCGHYVDQWDAATTYGNNEATGLDADSLAHAITTVLRTPTPAPADRTAREAERDLVRAHHDALYLRLARS